MGRRVTRRSAGPALVAAAVALAVAAPLAQPLAGQEGGDGDGEHPGKIPYDRWCAGCHGVDGRGEGPGAATMLPRPRDFTRAQYQIRTTGPSELPTDADVLHVIDVGMPGTAMPGWEDVLSRSERDDLVDYLKTFSRFFGQGDAPAPLDFGRAPGASDERIAEGGEIYQELECWQCHGQAGRGDGTSAPTLEDDTGFPIAAADLTAGWRFNGGATVDQIYRRLRTGVDGTPMPTFQDAVDAEIITDDQLWSLAHYVRSLSPEDEPPVREVIVAELVEDGALPGEPDDEAWDEAERFYVPLVGQIIEAPRWYAPRVHHLWVQALHDGTELALRVSWTDPTRSPAGGDWDAWATRVREVMEPKEEGGSWTPGAPDGLTVQFPLELSEGMDRPYFLQGDGRRPAYLWTWRSDRQAAGEEVARGLGTGQAVQRPAVRARAVHAEGAWSVVFRRTLATQDSAEVLQMPRARSIPVAFQAWDGDNGEAGHQGAVSTWYFINLRDATPATVYVAPVVALLLTGALGMFVVARAQKREREGVVHEES